MLPTVLADPYRILFPLMKINLSQLDCGNESIWSFAPGSFRVLEAARFLDPVCAVACCPFPVVEGHPEPGVGHVFDLETNYDLQSP